MEIGGSEIDGFVMASDPATSEDRRTANPKISRLPISNPVQRFQSHQSDPTGENGLQATADSGNRVFSDSRVGRESEGGSRPSLDKIRMQRLSRREACVEKNPEIISLKVSSKFLLFQLSTLVAVKPTARLKKQGAAQL